MTQLNKTLTLYKNRIEEKLNLTLKLYTQTTPPRLKDALFYAGLSPGKRIRAALVYGMADGFQIPLEQVDSLACSIEFIHAYSLVHDDLPAMDDDDLRRGRPTCHKAFDEATAILVGDGLLTMAFQILSHAPYLYAEQKLLAIQWLSQAAGQQGMIAGQALDIAAEQQAIPLAELTQLHQLKTGALIKTALLFGAIISPGFLQHQACIEKMGEKIGLAFQIQDDILDIESDTETLGKTQGRDIELDKSTFPKLLGIDASKQLRDQTIQEALSHLSTLPFKSEFLHDLIHYIAQRQV
jgi:geranylgeranyl pyrophosphate synthase